MEDGATSNPGAQGAYIYKNRLQEFAQRASIHLPVYQTFNEGSLHNPQFRSSVIVDGATFVSPCTFVKRKEAEQYVAKFAFENILMKIKQGGVPLIHNHAAFCKSILHEYVAKMKMELPTYTTSKSEGPLPTFITTVVFDGKNYRGGAGRSKKEAEQLGARTVIEWILGQSDTSIVMAEIIKSKAKLFNTFCRGTGSIVLQDDNMPLKVPVGNYLGDNVVKEKDMHIVSTNGKLSVPAVEHSIQPAAENHKEAENPNEAENPKKQQICEVCSGTTGGGSIVPTLQQGNRLEGSTSGPVNSVANDSCTEQIIQVKEDPKEPENSKEAENPKKQQICEVCPGTTGGGSTVPTLQQGDQLEGSTSGPVNSVMNDSCTEQIIQVKQEVPSEGPPTFLGQLQNSNPGTSGKRPHRKIKSGSNSKKMRTNKYFSGN